MGLGKKAGFYKKGCFWKAVIAVPAAGLLIFIFLVGVGAYLITADPLIESDVIVLLSGGDSARNQEAIRLLNRKLAPRIVITNTGSMAEEQELRAAGIPSEKIVKIQPLVSSTRDEALAILEAANEKGWKSLLVVTDPFHTERTRVIFRNVLKGSGINVVVYPVQGHWYRSDTWFLSAEGWQVTLLEYVKLAGYYLGLRID